MQTSHTALVLCSKVQAATDDESLLAVVIALNQLELHQHETLQVATLTTEIQFQKMGLWMLPTCPLASASASWTHGSTEVANDQIVTLVLALLPRAQI